MINSHRFVFTLFLLVTSFVACRDKSPEFVKNEGRWIPVLADMYAYQVAIESSDKTIRDSLKEVYRQQILEMHQVSEWDLELVMEEMGSTPKLAIDFLDKVIAYLDSLENELEVEKHHME